MIWRAESPEEYGSQLNRDRVSNLSLSMEGGIGSCEDSCFGMYEEDLKAQKHWQAMKRSSLLMVEIGRWGRIVTSCEGIRTLVHNPVLAVRHCRSASSCSYLLFEYGTLGYAVSLRLNLGKLGTEWHETNDSG